MARSPSDYSKKPRDTIKTLPRQQTDEAPTVIDGPKVHALDAEADKLGDDELMDFDDSDDAEPTRHRGSHPPKPSSSRRLSPTLMKIFQRKREQIGLSIAQVARLAGIDAEEYLRFEGTNGQHRLLYDHAVILARVLGVRPQDMPGLRGSEKKDEVAARANELEQALRSGPQLVFEGKSGERFGGDLDRVVTTPAFALTIGDDSLGEVFPRGSLLGFVADPSTRPRDVVLLRHRKSKLLALRRYLPPAYGGVQPWQPSYVVASGEWLCIARMQVMLPRSG